MLDIIYYPLKKNRCFQQNAKRTPIGIQIHSIGCPQSSGKAVADSFNEATKATFVTYICDAETAGLVYRCGSEDLYTWADAGYGNRNLITIEIAESKYMAYKPNSASYTVKNQAKFKADILRGYETAVQLCAKICKERGWDPYKKLEHGLYLISSHDEGRIAGCSSGHVDPTHIWSKFGLSMDTFRKAVKDAIGTENGGKKVSTSKLPQTKEEFIKKVGRIAVKLYPQTKILPSVVIGQCCVETGYGLGPDAKDSVKNRNILGMKADLINSTWKAFTVWDGRTFKKKTWEEYNGKPVEVYADFRKYKSFENCITDYEMFLLNVKNDAGYKYRKVAGMTDPKEVITAISKGGYATDSRYISKVMAAINANRLTDFDKEAMKAVEKPKVTTKYAVRRKLVEKKYELGRYSNLKEAKKIANLNWGYRVYDLETNKAVYTPKLNRWQKFIANMIWFDIYVRDDNAKGKQWFYFNGKRSKGSFWETRKAGWRWTNCCGAVQFALYAAGVPKKALQWYFAKGKVVWLNDHAEKDAREYFNIIELKKKTVKEYVDDGTVVPGDIIGYVGFGHTNAYVMPGYSFDAGHLWCKGTGEGAEYTKWVGPLAYGNRKPAFVFRLKD